MKKIWIYACLALVMVYAGIWFFAANKIEGEVYKALDQLKVDNKLKKYSTKVSVSGFPFSFNVKFASLSLGLKTGDDNSDVNVIFDGNVNAKVGLFSRYFTATTLGNLHLKGNIGDYRFHVVSEGDRLSTYKIKFSGLPVSPFFIKKAMALQESSKPNYLDLIQGFSTDTRAFLAHDKVAEKTIAEATRIQLSVFGDFASNGMSLTGKEFIDRVKFFPESRRLWQNLQRIPMIRSFVQSINPNVKNYFNVFSLDELGVMNYDIDFAYEGSKSSHEIKFSKLLLRDDLYAIDAKGTFLFSNKGAIDTNFNSTTICSDKWYILMKQYINTLNNKIEAIEEDYSNKSIIGLIMSPITGFMNKLLKHGGYGEYLPQLNLVGPVKTEANLSYKTLNKDSFNTIVKKLHVSTRTYFIDVKGNLKREAEKDIYNIKAELGNYVSIIDQIVDYVNRVSVASNYKFKLLGSEAISTSISDKIKRFLRNVSDNPSSQSKDVKLTIVSSGKSVYPAVGPYSSEEFHQAWNGFVASIIVDKVTDRFENVLKKGGSGLKESLKGNVVGGVKDVAQGLLGLLS